MTADLPVCGGIMIACVLSLLVHPLLSAEEYEFRRAAFAALQETRERTARLLKRAAAAEKDLQAAR